MAPISTILVFTGSLMALYGLVIISRRRTLIGLIVLALGGGVVLFSLFPEKSTELANYLGVGRGADLILYLFTGASILLFISLLARIWGLEEQMRILVASLSHESAQAPSGSPENPWTESHSSNSFEASSDYEKREEEKESRESD